MYSDLDPRTRSCELGGCRQNLVPIRQLFVSRLASQVQPSLLSTPLFFLTSLSLHSHLLQKVPIDQSLSQQNIILTANIHSIRARSRKRKQKKKSKPLLTSIACTASASCTIRDHNRVWLLHSDSREQQQHQVTREFSCSSSVTVDASMQVIYTGGE